VQLKCFLAAVSASAFVAYTAGTAVVLARAPPPSRGRTASPTAPRSPWMGLAWMTLAAGPCGMVRWIGASRKLAQVSSR
jgi:hypothetical protein